MCQVQILLWADAVHDDVEEGGVVQMLEDIINSTSEISWKMFL